MKRSICIRKTKTNIFLLFLLGLVIGGILGLRQGAAPTGTSSEADILVPMNATVKGEGTDAS